MRWISVSLAGMFCAVLGACDTRGVHQAKGPAMLAQRILEAQYPGLRDEGAVRAFACSWNMKYGHGRKDVRERTVFAFARDGMVRLEEDLGPEHGWFVAGIDEKGIPWVHTRDGATGLREWSGAQLSAKQRQPQYAPLIDDLDWLWRRDPPLTDPLPSPIGDLRWIREVEPRVGLYSGRRCYGFFRFDPGLPLGAELLWFDAEERLLFRRIRTYGSYSGGLQVIDYDGYCIIGGVALPLRISRRGIMWGPESPKARVRTMFLDPEAKEVPSDVGTINWDFDQAILIDPKSVQCNARLPGEWFQRPAGGKPVPKALQFFEVRE